jgi:hypothetical protein
MPSLEGKKMIIMLAPKKAGSSNKKKEQPRPQNTPAPEAASAEVAEEPTETEE